MLTRRSVVVCLCAGILTMTGCASADSADSPRAKPGPSVVAEVGASSVSIANVREHLVTDGDGPAVILPRALQPDLWRIALDDAVRDALLSLEATRLGLVGPAAPADSRSGLARAMINRERARVASLSPTSISDAAARTWFSGHKAQFQKVESAHVAWARLGDRTTALTLLDQSQAQTEAQFLQAARTQRAAAVGTATLDHAGKGADVLVARAAFALASPGATGLVEGEGGSWWLVRLGQVVFESPPWGTEMASQSKSAMAWDREQAHLKQLAQQLETRWAVVVHEDRFDVARPGSLKRDEAQS